MQFGQIVPLPPRRRSARKLNGDPVCPLSIDRLVGRVSSPLFLLLSPRRPQTHLTYLVGVKTLPFAASNVGWWEPGMV